MDTRNGPMTRAPTRLGSDGYPARGMPEQAFNSNGYPRNDYARDAYFSDPDGYSHGVTNRRHELMLSRNGMFNGMPEEAEVYIPNPKARIIVPGRYAAPRFRPGGPQHDEHIPVEEFARMRPDFDDRSIHMPSQHHGGTAYFDDREYNDREYDREARGRAVPLGIGSECPPCAWPLHGGNISEQDAMPPEYWGTTTTIIMRNIPNKYTQRMLLTELNEVAFLGTFDFLYLPIDPETHANRGYAFVNFISTNTAWLFKLAFHGRRMNRFKSSKVISVGTATLQGFDANYMHYSGCRSTRRQPAAVRPLFLRTPSEFLLNATRTMKGKGRGKQGKRGGRAHGEKM